MEINAEELTQALGERLFADAESHVYAILDGASIPELLPHLYEQQPEHVCLYRGELEPDTAEVAPYLALLHPDEEFTVWLLEYGWGQHWGIFAASHADLREMRRHLRSLLTVSDPEGKPVLFRYYDPRVLRMYLPTCNAGELATVFGPIRSFTLEAEDPRVALHFRLEAGSLRAEQEPLL